MLFATPGSPDPSSGAPSITVSVSADSVTIGDGSETTFGLTVKPPPPPPNGKETGFPVTAARTIPFQSLASFSPDGVASSIPELHRLNVIRDLVLELQSSLRNNRSFQKAVREALKPENLANLQSFQTWTLTNFPLFKIASQ